MLELLKPKEVKKYKRITLNSGSTLFFENDYCEYVGIIESGQLIIKSYTNDGKEIIYNTINKNEIFGNNLIFSSHPYYKGDVIALKDTTVLLITKKQIVDLLKNNNDFLLTYLAKQADITKDFNDKIKLLSLDKAEDRLLYYLDSHNNEINFTSITALAKELNIQRETLSRTISKMVKKKAIAIKANTIKRP